jgi:tRNA (guanine37-N1)-methyltransferase
MKISLLTLFPQLLTPWLNEAILGRAIKNGLLEFEVHDIRNATTDKHRMVDDTPYGGGAGMVLKVDVLEHALKVLPPADEVILLTPAGERFTQTIAENLSKKQHIVLLCGRYEGFDARVETLVTRELSLGDFVMMGGEAAALCLIEAVTRLVPGVLGDSDSHEQDSFSSGILDYPEFTRPQVWNGLEVPEILRGGNHAAIATWRRREALRRTLERRPDLIQQAGLNLQDSKLLLELGVTLEQLIDWKLELPPPPKVKRKRHQ